MARNENIFSNLGKDFKKKLEAVVARVLIENGVKQNSDIIKSIEFTEENSRDSMYMYVNDYYQHISKGRKPRAKKIPIHALITWIKKNNITPRGRTSVNQLAFLIQRSIYLNGLKGKNFINIVEKSVTDIVEIEVADYLADFVTDSLHTAFKVK